MKKIILIFFMFFLVSSSCFTQEFFIGKIRLKDSLGTLVITPPPGGGFKINQENWVKTKDLDTNVAGLGLSYNKTFGLRFNAGNGLEIGSNDSVISTGEVSLLSVDSLLVGGKIIKTEGDLIQIGDQTDSAYFLGNVWIDGGSLVVRGQGTSQQIYMYNSVGSFSIGVNKLLYNAEFNNHYGGSWFDYIINSTSILKVDSANGLTFTSEGSGINFNNGIATSVGTTDNFDLVLKRNDAAYLTLGGSDLTLHGDTPLKFADANLIVAIDLITTAVIQGIPSGTSATHSGWIKMKDNGGDIIYIPYWK